MDTIKSGWTPYVTYYTMLYSSLTINLCKLFYWAHFWEQNWGKHITVRESIARKRVELLQGLSAKYGDKGSLSILLKIVTFQN